MSATLDVTVPAQAGPPTTPARRLVEERRAEGRDAPASDPRVATLSVTDHRPDPDATAVLQILREAVDLGSLSDEPLRRARGRAQRHHLSPDRANVLRALDLPAHAVVLEIGAGCGALTRYLAESCAAVDALETSATRAACVAERTRDQHGVRVFVGELGDIPAVAAYDVVVLVSAPAAVPGGAIAPTPAVLADVAARLRPGGAFVLAVENKLGVKYLVGAPDDNTGRVFDSVEGYPHGRPAARGLDRRELTAAIRGAGLSADVAVAFPDHVTSRAVLRPELFGEKLASLLHRVPHFPSPDRVGARAPLGDEHLTWRSLVTAGLAGETGNSFVVVAGKTASGGRAPVSLWPAGVAGAFYSVGRRGPFLVESRIDVAEPEGLIRRRRLAGPTPAGPTPAGAAQDVIAGGAARPDGQRVGDTVTLTVRDSPFVPSRDLLDLLVDTDDPATAGYLTRWSELVRAAGAARQPAGMPIDLVPHNLVVDTAGAVVVIDDEWRSPAAGPELVLGRGALYVGIHLAHGHRPIGPWAGCDTVRDAVIAVGRVVGLAADGSWISEVVEQEAWLHTCVLARDGDITDDERHRQLVNYLQAVLAGRLHARDDALQRLRRLRVERDRAAAELGEHRVELDRIRAELAGCRDDLARTTADLARERTLRDEALVENDLLRATLSWRVTEPLRGVKRAAAGLTRSARGARPARSGPGGPRVSDTGTRHRGRPGGRDRHRRRRRQRVSGATGSGAVRRCRAHNARAAPDQLNSAARARPLDTRSAASAGSPATAASASPSASGSSRRTTTAAVRSTSSTSAGASEVTTGTPAAIASSTGRPNPSARDGAANTVAPASTAARSASSTEPSACSRAGGRPAAAANPARSTSPHPRGPITASGRSPRAPAVIARTSTSRPLRGSSVAIASTYRSARPSRRRRAAASAGTGSSVTPCPMTCTRSAAAGNSPARSSATASEGTAMASARAMERVMIARCQRTPRGVSVSGCVHGTASWTVTTCGCRRRGASGVVACSRSPATVGGQPRSHSALSARCPAGSRSGPSAPGMMAGRTSRCHAVTVRTVQPGGGAAASAVVISRA